MPATATDLIRQALNERAATITPDTLIYHEMPSPRRSGASAASDHGRGGITLLASAAAVVAVLATVIGTYALTRGPDNNAPATGSDDQLTGIRWTLSHVRSADHGIDHPTDYRAYIGFSDNDRVSGVDGPNAFDGTYHTSGHTITIRITVSGAVGSSGTSDGLAAVNSLYMPGDPAQSTAVASRYTVSADTLSISTPTWTLTFRNDGPEATTVGTPTPTSTSTTP